jgi:predicted nucleotidyltransferase
MEVQYSQVSSLQAPLKSQIDSIKASFPINANILSTLLLGSCSRGTATYRSDIDILVVIDGEILNYGVVTSTRDWIESEFEKKAQLSTLTQPLEVQFTIVLKSVFNTSEPAMRDALSHAIALVDPLHLFKNFQERK